MDETLFTAKIRALRKKAGYTQAEVSKRLNIQRQTYCNYENATRNPPMEIIVALAELYQVSVDSLVCDTIPAASQKTSARPRSTELHFVSEFTSLSGNKQREVMDFIRFKKQLPD